jgi:hypothetical protein
MLLRLVAAAGFKSQRMYLMCQKVKAHLLGSVDYLNYNEDFDHVGDVLSVRFCLLVNHKASRARKPR